MEELPLRLPLVLLPVMLPVAFMLPPLLPAARSGSPLNAFAPRPKNEFRRGASENPVCWLENEFALLFPSVGP
jgi:hypothetical protein